MTNELAYIESYCRDAGLSYVALGLPGEEEAKFAEALIGYIEDQDARLILVYEEETVIEICASICGSYEDGVDWYCYNIQGSDGPGYPIYI